MSTTISPPPGEPGVNHASQARPPTPPIAPEPAPPESPPFDVPSAPRTIGRGGVAGGLILIAVGIVFLLGNLVQTGGLLFLGLGTAFLVARLLTGHYGYAVPAGILLGFGAFVTVSEIGPRLGLEQGGAFFIFLGLGFVASYVIGGRPGAVWPVFPAAALVGFGLFVQAVTQGWAIGEYVWLGRYWPLALVAIGAWLLVRDQIPQPARTGLAVAGGSALLLAAFLVAAAGVANIGSAVTGPWWPPSFQPLPWTGSPPLQDTIQVVQPMLPGDIVSVSNTSGRTVVRSTDSPTVRVEATRHYWSANNAPEVRLVPSAGGLSVESNASSISGPNGSRAYIDYIIDVPTSAGVSIASTSGRVEVNGVGGPLQVNATSGDIVVADVRGTSVVRGLSGDIRLTRIAGPLDVVSTSGDVRGTAIDHLQAARTTSGRIDLAGVFTANAEVGSTSGHVTLHMASGSSLRVNARTMSGSIHASAVPLNDRREAARVLSGTLGSGAASLTVATTSGDIILTNEP